MGTKNKEDPKPPTVPSISASKASKINKSKFSKVNGWLFEPLRYGGKLSYLTVDRQSLFIKKTLDHRYSKIGVFVISFKRGYLTKIRTVPTRNNCHPRIRN